MVTNNLLDEWINEWVKVKITQSCPALWDPMDYTVHGILQARIPELDSHSLLQGIFPAQGSNPGLLLCMWILFQLSHQGSPRMLEWVACPFSSRSSLPRNQTVFFCIADRFFTNWAIREASNWVGGWVELNDLDPPTIDPVLCLYRRMFILFFCDDSF